MPCHHAHRTSFPAPSTHMHHDLGTNKRRRAKWGSGRGRVTARQRGTACVSVCLGRRGWRVGVGVRTCADWQTTSTLYSGIEACLLKRRHSVRTCLAADRGVASSLPLDHDRQLAARTVARLSNPVFPIDHLQAAQTTILAAASRAAKRSTHQVV